MNHGTATAYKDHRCRCTPCREANRVAQIRYRLRRLNGTLAGTDLVDAADVRRWLQYLQRQGVSAVQVAVHSGNPYSTDRINALRNGTRTQLTRRVAMAIYRVRPVVALDTSRVPGELTRARVHGLMARGFPGDWIDERIGTKATQLGRNGAAVTVRAARAVAKLCDEVGYTTGPDPAVAKRACSNGWLPWGEVDDNLHELA